MTAIAAGGAPTSAEAAPASGTARVFVQFDADPALAVIERQDIDTRGPVSRAAKDQLDKRRDALRAQQRRFVEAANDAGIDARARRHVTGLINGVAVTVPAADTDRLAGLPGVAAVVPDTLMKVNTDTSVNLVGAREVWNGRAGGGTGARGDGMTVAVIDSGVDYTHRDLGAGFGPGHKVVAGHDFVNNDADPADDNGHGTHVAGIIAADGEGDPDRITGVAPHAELTAYKVMDDRGLGYVSDIIAGLDAAVDPANPHRADVVNMSLGGPGDGTDPLGLAASAAVDLGVVVVASAGNSGPGAQTVGTPASARGVISVGASASGVALPTARVVSPREDLLQTFRAPYSASAPSEPVTGELVDVGEGTAADYDRVGDVRGKVVAYRASIPEDMRYVSPEMLDQARLAEDRGAVALLAYEESGGGPVLAAGEPVGEPPAPPTGQGVPVVPGTQESGDSFRMDKIVVLGVSELQWPELAADLEKGPVRVSVGGRDVTDEIAAFSSRGPAADFHLEPDLVAPGVEISSTWPTDQWAPGKYRVSGTSMAAPHVAGAAALLRQLRPDESVERIGGRLIGSAAPAKGDAAPTGQGAGRLDVAAAADASLTASPTSLSLGLADLTHSRISDRGEVTLHNTEDRPVTVDLRARPSAGDAGKASVSPPRVHIPAGGSATVTVAVSGDRPDRDQDLSGWLIADPRQDGSPTLRVPYLLAARPLLVQASPDPSDGRSSAFVYSPTELASPPTLTVTPPRGRPTTVRMTHDHGTWYRAALNGTVPGTYAVAASADTTGGTRLVGGSYLEVLPQDNRPGGDRWEPIGPNSEAGDISTTPADPSVAALARYQTLAPWTTDDSGRTWTQRSRLPVAAGTGQIVIDSTDAETMWYAVNSGTDGVIGVTLDPTYQGRLLRTRDGGRTWQVLDVPDVRIRALVSDQNTRVLIAVTADGLLVSRDDGDHWTSQPSPVSGDLQGAAVGGDDLYLADSTTVWAVRDIAGPAPGTPQVEQVHTAEHQPLGDLVADGDLVAVLDDEDRVIGSRDSGRTWQELYQVADRSALSMVMDNGTLAVFTYRNTHHLGRDHGTTWEAVEQPVRGAVETDIAHWGPDGLLWTSPGAGMFRTRLDGTDPQRIGVQGKTVYDLAVTTGQDGVQRLLAGTDSDVYRTPLPTGEVTPQTREWGLTGKEAYFGVKVGQLAVDPDDPGTVWKIRKDAVSRFHVYRSTDGGETWERRGTTGETPFGLALGSGDDERVAVPFWSLRGSGLYVTRNGGTTWKKLFHDEIFTTIAADPSDPDRLWLGSSRGLYRSDDFGTTVTKVADGAVRSLWISSDGQRVVAGGPDIRVSEDSGRTFRVAEASEAPTWVSEVVSSPTNPGTLYAATRSFTANGLLKGGRGVLRSTDGGRTWVNVSGGLQNLSVVSLATSPDGRWLYAGTEDGGAHRLRIG
ncbi:S8 family serine peptidase [Wenjunlia vitaminophila]|uniref:S8 family serine peptidase n=1 Tax=Wenjunlia vitaminophila TaxID=76728 RepID=UPI0012FEFBB2|nr:S8 family serine peptidase [Wenjunlia vitaminophila]